MAQNALFDPGAACPAVSTTKLVAELVKQKISSNSVNLQFDGRAEIVVDSRKLTSGCIFIAIKGHAHDGHDEIKTAAAAGSALIICERSDPTVKIPQLVVRNSREAWAWACSFAYEHPGSKLKLIGVTGTNGKTSTVWMIRCILNSFGIKTATVGTLGFYLESEHHENPHTTPDPPMLYAFLQAAVAANCRALVMEVTSHALVQEKLAPLRFFAAGMTNFTQDHLDFHGTMAEYFAAKMAFFQKLLSPHAHVFLHESVASEVCKSVARDATIKVYGRGTDVDVYIESNPSHQRGSTNVRIAEILSTKQKNASSQYQIPFIGNIFADNFCAALLAAQSIIDDVFGVNYQAKISAQITAVPGRLEPVRTPKPWRPLVLVDHSHTPDALENALAVARSITTGKLVCVFGCGGDRDRKKRPIMGRISTRLADFTVVTSDNPRSEDPEAIVDEILSGLPADDTQRTEKIVDRRLALKATIDGYGAGDTILVAGKGHETYQIIGATKYPFSDVLETRQILEHPKTWCVVGTGVSGMAAALYLRQCGDVVIVSDGAKLPDASIKDLQIAGIKVFDKGHDPSHLDEVKAVALSPGVSSENVLLKLAILKGLPIATEIDLGLEHFAGTLISVTGTNGKSTTCALMEHALKSMGLNAAACGNIGRPPTALLPESWNKGSFWVCELSSYQLEHSHLLPTKVAAFTSFSIDHLARHKTVNEYFRCKWRITEGLGGDDLLLLRGDVFNQANTMGFELPESSILVVYDQKPEVLAHCEGKVVRMWWIESNAIMSCDGPVATLETFELPGLHNAINAAFTIAAISHLTKKSAPQIVQHLIGFTGLPYRCQNVGVTSQGKPIINDSKSTNLESTLIALSATTVPVVLLMGGAGKGESYLPLNSAKNKIAAIVLFGASRREIKKDLPADLLCEMFEHMRDAVKHALSLAQSLGCGLLLSPGCASFDEFRNYEHRGDVFNQLIQ